MSKEDGKYEYLKWFFKDKNGNYTPFIKSYHYDTNTPEYRNGVFAPGEHKEYAKGLKNKHNGYHRNAYVWINGKPTKPVDRHGSQRAYSAFGYPKDDDAARFYRFEQTYNSIKENLSAKTGGYLPIYLYSYWVGNDDEDEDGEWDDITLAVDRNTGNVYDVNSELPTMGGRGGISNVFTYDPATDSICNTRTGDTTPLKNLEIQNSMIYDTRFRSTVDVRSPIFIQTFNNITGSDISRSNMPANYDAQFVIDALEQTSDRQSPISDKILTRFPVMSVLGDDYIGTDPDTHDSFYGANGEYNIANILTKGNKEKLREGNIYKYRKPEAFTGDSSNPADVWNYALQADINALDRYGNINPYMTKEQYLDAKEAGRAPVLVKVRGTPMSIEDIWHNNGDPQRDSAYETTLKDLEIIGELPIEEYMHQRQPYDSITPQQYEAYKQAFDEYRESMRKRTGVHDIKRTADTDKDIFGPILDQYNDLIEANKHMPAFEGGYASSNDKWQYAYDNANRVNMTPSLESFNDRYFIRGSDHDDIIRKSALPTYLASALAAHDKYNRLYSENPDKYIDLYNKHMSRGFNKVPYSAELVPFGPDALNKIDLLNALNEFITYERRYRDDVISDEENEDIRAIQRTIEKLARDYEHDSGRGISFYDDSAWYENDDNWASSLAEDDDGEFVDEDGEPFAPSELHESYINQLTDNQRQFNKMKAAFAAREMEKLRELSGGNLDDAMARNYLRGSLKDRFLFDRALNEVAKSQPDSSALKMYRKLFDAGFPVSDNDNTQRLAAKYGFVPTEDYSARTTSPVLHAVYNPFHIPPSEASKRTRYKTFDKVYNSSEPNGIDWKRLLTDHWNPADPNVGSDYRIKNIEGEA